MPAEFVFDSWISSLSESPFVVFLVVYMLTMAGNLGLIILVNTNHSLQNPMYYFMSNLSFLDICYSTTIAPQMLANFVASRKRISFHGCTLQMFSFPCCEDTECLPCPGCHDLQPLCCCPPASALLCTDDPSICLGLVLLAYASWEHHLASACLAGLRLLYCGSNVVDHFFCDIPPLLALSCVDTHTKWFLLFTLCGFIQSSIFMVISVSYACILHAILRIRSSGSRSKAFSTCAPHLLAVALFYRMLLFMYLRPAARYSPTLDKGVAVSYTIVFPMFNPIIYSFRNKGVKNTLRKFLEKEWIFK